MAKTCNELFTSVSVKDPSEHLQAAGAKVAARIYSHFGYRIEASPPAGSRPADLTKLDTPRSRQLRLISALLKDRTIEEEPSALWETAEGELVITKLSRSLGYFPVRIVSDGRFKSYTTSHFDSPTNIFALTEFSDFRLPENHAWRHIIQEDVVGFVRALRSLTDDDLRIATDHGGYVNASEREHVFRSLMVRRDVLISKILELFPKLDPHSGANQIVDQLALDKLPTPEKRLDRIGFFVSRNMGGFVDQVRQTNNERVHRALTLETSAEKFRNLTDEQVYAQWGGNSKLTLKSSDKFKYLGKVTGLKRGDRVHLTRTVSLTKHQLLELLKTRLYVSHFLFVFNYDVSLLQAIYNRIGGRTTQELIDHNVGMGGTAIRTTYAVDGWAKTRYDKPLIYNPKLGSFDLQVHFSVPVEAIVTVDQSRLPSHVAENPSGFGFAGSEANQESEISFLNWIPPEFIATDFHALQSQLANGTYPRQTVNRETGNYD